MKRSRSNIAVTLGPVIVMASIVWEYARTNPDYRYLVEPWSLRGYEIDQGWSYFAVGAALLLLGLAVIPRRAVEVPYSATVVGLAAVVAAILGSLLGPDTVIITVSGLMAAVLSLLLWLMLYRTFKSLLLPRAPNLDRFGIRTVISLGILVLVSLVITMGFGGDTFSLNPGLAAFLVVGLLGLFALATAPRGLAANRILIYSSLLGGAIITLSGGSLRTSLQEAQTAASGAAAQYKDVQVGYGWFIALFGIMVLFVGAVALWATRRDVIITRSRAQEQRAAAEKSAQEIRESYEQYDRERATASSAPQD